MERDDLVYHISIPWRRHPSCHLASGDSILLIAWDNFFEQNGKLLLPSAHHALMDGESLGRFFARLQELLNRPEA
jgi:chloramphenicol O-acetyltransferase type A